MQIIHAYDKHTHAFMLKSVKTLSPTENAILTLE